MSIIKRIEKAIRPNHYSQYWVKPIHFLNKNWALVETSAGNATVHFINERSEIFDRIEFCSEHEAIAELDLNGFRPLSGHEDPFYYDIPHPPYAAGTPYLSGPRYSLGEYWMKL
jgi:hypothetical protein